MTSEWWGIGIFTSIVICTNWFIVQRNRKSKDASHFLSRTRKESSDVYSSFSDLEHATSAEIAAHMTTMDHKLGISMEHLSKRKRGTLKPIPEGKTDLMHKGHTAGGKLIVVMVGLPGRGKSYMAKKIARYLNWINYETRVFNIGNYRRQILGTDHSADFFDPDNEAGYRQRKEMASAAMKDMISYLEDRGEVAIYDGTNSTSSRRQWIKEQIKPQSHYHLLFIESVCEDDAIIEHNIIETKLKSPDYQNVSPEEAVKDFRERIQMYRKYYESLGEKDTDFSYVQVINAGERLVMNRVYGFLPMKILSFVSNLHIVPRPIMLTRHGENYYNIKNKVGGDPNLTVNGLKFSRGLANLLAQHQTDFPADRISVWTSTAKCAIKTSSIIQCNRVVQWRALRELESGKYSGLSYAEIQALHPKQFNMRAQNKLHYRYPQGESYLDVIARLEPVIYELERQREPVVIVAHQAVIRCLYAYFLDMPPEKIPYLSVPLHTAIELYPTAYGCRETRYELYPEPRVHG